MASTQNVTVADLLSTLGLTGYSGNITAAIGDPTTTVAIDCDQPAYAILGDGAVLTAELVDAVVAGLTTDDSYSLYLDYVDNYDGRAAVWTVATSAPSSRAIVVAAVTVASSVVSNVTMATAGLNGTALAALNIVAGDA